MNRRDLLATLPVLPALAVASAAIADEPETEIMRLFREWQALRKQERDLIAAWGVSAYASPLGEAVAQETGRIEWEIIATPCRNARDFVAKVVCWTCNGEVELPSETQDPTLWAEANKLIGMPA